MRAAMPQHLLVLEAGLQRQQPQSLAAAVQAQRIQQHPAQDLQAAADAQHPTAACRVSLHPDIQTLPAQPGQVGTGVLGAGQDDPVLRRQCRSHAGITHRHQLYALQRRQRLELVQVADARRHQQRNLFGHGRGIYDRQGRSFETRATALVNARCLAAVTPAARCPTAPRLSSLPRGSPTVPILEPAILFRQPVTGPHRNGGHHRHAGQFQHALGRRGQQAGIAPEAVQHEALQTPAVILGNQRPGAVQVREGASPIDVRHQQAGRIGMPRHAQVHHVAGLQVDLGRRPRPLDHDHVVLAAQRIQGLRQQRPDLGAAGPPGQRSQLGVDPAQQHHLAAGVGLGLEQQRIHLHRRLHPGRQCLEILGTADLAARHHAGVVAHVLRLEGRHPQPLPRIPAAQRRAQPALAGPAAGAQHHHAAGRAPACPDERHQSSMPRCAGTPASKACLTLVISVTVSASAMISGGQRRPVSTTCTCGGRLASVSSTGSSGIQP